MRADPPLRASLGIRPKAAAVAALMILVLLLVRASIQALTEPLTFDDAFMFYRYATHITQGLGIAWNNDGVATYGTTSQAWLLVVLLFSGLGLPPDTTLQLASWLTGTAALLLIVRGVARRGRSPWAATIAFTGGAMLLLSGGFASQLGTGMDTMLAFGVSAVIAFVVIDQLARPRPARMFVSGALACAAFLIRPDGLLCALAVPFLAWALGPGERAYRPLLVFAATAIVPIGAFVLACYLYFGTPLPLSFYVKSANGYAGFQNAESSVGYLIQFLSLCLPFILAAILAGMRRTWCIVFLVPMALTIVYLLTVKQVMGWDARFYIPLLPYLVIPALLSVDAALSRARPVPRGRTVLAVAVAAACFGAVSARSHLVAWHLSGSTPLPIAVPEGRIIATRPLPQVPWFANITRFADDIASKVPAGTLIAASEVGYLGVAAPQADILDMVGLNDTEIGRKGFDADRFVARGPDLVWLPHTDYTGIRAQILSNAAFRDRYVVVRGAYNFGIAVRNDSPHYAALRELVVRAWPRTYRGTRLEDYIVAFDVTG